MWKCADSDTCREGHVQVLLWSLHDTQIFLMIGPCVLNVHWCSYKWLIALQCSWAAKSGNAMLCQKAVDLQNLLGNPVVNKQLKKLLYVFLTKEKLCVSTQFILWGLNLKSGHLYCCRTGSVHATIAMFAFSFSRMCIGFKSHLSWHSKEDTMIQLRRP